MKSVPAAGMGKTAATTKASPAAANTNESATEMANVVAQLREFVAALQQRKDIRVTKAILGPKASARDVAAVRKLHPELADFYAEMNGIHVEWEFVEPPGGGCLRVPLVVHSKEFRDDDDHCMNFGDETEALLLDAITPEGNTWLVRDRETKTIRILFASAAEGAEGVVAAKSLPEYFRKAMHHGFVEYWPRCFQKNRYVSYATQEESVRRFQSPAVAPTKIKAGQRVQFGYFSESGRGDVLAVYRSPKSRESEYYGTEFAKVRLDEGTVAWMPMKFMKAYKKQDAYERLRNEGFDFDAAIKADLDGVLLALAHALGPMEHYSSYGPSNSRRAAGLLGRRLFHEAVEIVLNLHAAVKRKRVNLATSRPIPKSEDSFVGTDYARFRHEYTIDGVFKGLYGGLRLLAHHESARQKVPAKDLVPDVKIVETESWANSFLDTIEDNTILEPPKYHSQEPPAALKLPQDAPLFAGSGF